MGNLRTISILLILALGLTVSLWLQSDTSSQLWVVICFGLIVPALLLLGAIRKSRNWGNLIALTMIFYATVGVMDVIASSGQFVLALGVATVSIVLFFTSIYAERG
jgi:uncharacterized membrane protein